ncbi:hypothetical protein QAD02_005662 [Eretmocerus hayati]|uniref:Uncharacterized protein n=1 Tax=Eretmocerus hayati TaxID=131215 RepID=A0ACC2NXY6_9HYME|nr:hypothetical protein QAD02_005662 [Eretmocerus hayati]
MDELPDLDVQAVLGSTIDDDASLDCFLAALIPDYNGSQSMDTSEVTSSSCNSEIPAITGEQRTGTSSTVDTSFAPTATCTPFEIDFSQIPIGAASQSTPMVERTPQAEPILIELDTDEPIPGTSTGNCCPRGKASIVKRLNSRINHGESLNPVKLTKHQMRHLKDKLRRIPACQDMMRIIDSGRMGFFAESIDVQEPQHGGP